ncbi:MAG: hypothetical protein ACXWIG_11075 [Caldimonas sp.]
MRMGERRGGCRRRSLVARLQPKYTSDPAYVFGVNQTGVDTYAELGATPAARDALKRSLAPLLGNLGTTSRAFVRSPVAAGR